MTERESDAASEARLIVFFLALPDPLPYPHDGTLTFFLEDEVPVLEGVEFHVTREQAALPPDFGGRQFVSLKFWQVRVSSGSEIALHDAVSKVMREVLPTGMIGDGEDSTAPPEELTEGVATVVEMVTVGTPSQAEDWISEAFDRCLACVIDIARAYRIQARAHTPQLSYERLPFAVPWALRDLGSPPSWHGVSMLVLHYNLRALPSPDQLEGATMAEVMALLSFLRKSHPFIVYSERTVDAEHALRREGDYGNAVVHAALAAEILLDALLSLLYWEEQAAPVDVADSVFSKTLMERVRTEYHPRLGGAWQTVGKGPVAQWAQVLARLRGRVVHRGYRPTRDEVQAAVAVGNALDGFVRHRLAAKVSAYPRTALLLLGRRGLERLGGWKKVAPFVAEQADNEPEWITAFRDWRDELDQVRADSSGWS